ncbi:MAG TPA: ABC transporter permease [Spirochaetota bacterium]|nr:ABC transporter permease [Spirochaetota bacterium]HPI90381.1 ABC transporter permease [Spirochaetota bacterium]HPR47521.1 ABC transporter permease [Spirochaetota bacterium]
MMTFIKLGWRNIWRHRRRSLVVISSISIGVFAMMFSAGFMNGMNVQMVENTISTSLGHIAVHRRGFQDNMKLEFNFSAGPKMLETIDKTPLVKAWAPRVKMQAMVRSSESSRGVMIVGIDPEREKNISKIYDYTRKEDGSRFISGRNTDEILISREMAEKLDLLLGDRLVVMLQDKDNEIIGTGLRVCGLYETPVNSYDRFVVFVGIEKLQAMNGLGKNISEISVLLHDKKDVDTVKDALIAGVNDRSLEILSWKDMAPSLVKSIRLFDTMMFIFFAIIFMTVVFSIANTLIMAIMERFHEIGVMKSIGTRPRRIFFMILFEAFSLGLIGVVAGIAAGMVLHVVLSYTGIDLSLYQESMRVWGTGSVIYPVIRFIDIVNAVIIVFFTTFIAALYPAVKAARIKPLEALHFI